MQKKVSEAMKVFYFAYGSNMNSERMLSRIPDARVVSIAKLLNKKMLCNKKSSDDSGKANLVESTMSEVWGVLYEFEDTNLVRLDEIEAGYKRIEEVVLLDDDKHVKAYLYMSNNLTSDQRPYDDYKEHIVKGAKMHNLPPDYVEYLTQIISKPKK